MHTLLDLRGNIPSFIHITDGKTQEVNVMDDLVLEVFIARWTVLPDRLYHIDGKCIAKVT